MNPQITNPNVIHVGIHLAAGAVARPVVPHRPSGAGTYVVRPGDTLYRTPSWSECHSRHCSLPIRTLTPRYLQPGMTPRLPGGGIIVPPPQLPLRPPADTIALAGINSDDGVTCPAMRGE